MEGLFDDLNALKLSQDYADTVGVKKILATVPVQPNKQDFVRVHPDPDFRLSPAALIELKDDRETYIVTPTMAANLPGEFVPCTLFLTINRQGVLRVWPVKLPGSDGKINPWHHSAAEAAERAMSCWVRMTSNMSLGAYEIFEATSNNLPRAQVAGRAFLPGNPTNSVPGSCRRQPGPSPGPEVAGPNMTTLPFREVWLVDFEFGAPPGDIQEPVCLVAWELNSGRKMRLWRDEFGTTPPYSTGSDALFIAYYASGAGQRDRSPRHHGQQRSARSDSTELNPASGDWAVPQKAATALDRYGRVEEIADTVAFVAGPEASYITGANITVDGGMNA